MAFELTGGQDNAIKKMVMWWKLISAPQVFQVSGVAGTGKSTIVYEAINRLGLDIQTDVAFIAFTGKAALVLNQKGLPATTAHKLIYNVTDASVPKLDSKGNPLKDNQGNIIYKTITKFIKKFSLPINIKLLVLDEGSMIPVDIWEDLKSFNIPIIVLGDSMQLPPIHGKSPLLQEPDVVLTEIMRQQAGNPIIHLSMLAREGKKIPYGKYGKRAVVLHLNEVTDRMLTASDINLVTTNKTRDEINDHVRYNILKRTGRAPVKGDKIICRKNNWDITIGSIPLINGLIGYVQNPINLEKMHDGYFHMDFRPDFIPDNWFENIETNLKVFEETNYKKRQELIKSRFEPGEKFECSHAITTHLSQGSSWRKVLYYYEPYGDKDMRKRLAYTGITRSEDLLILAQ